MKKICSILFLCVICFCTGNESPITGGGASETVAMVQIDSNRIDISVESKKPFNYDLILCNENYSILNPLHYHSTSILTHDSSQFTPESLSDGNYHILLIDTVSDSGTFFKVNISRTSKVKLEKKLTANSKLSGNVIARSNQNIDRPASGYIVFLYGTPFSARTDSLGNYLISGVPEGNYKINAVEDLRKENETWFFSECEAISGETVSVQEIIVNEQ